MPKDKISAHVPVMINWHDFETNVISRGVPYDDIIGDNTDISLADCVRAINRRLFSPRDLLRKTTLYSPTRSTHRPRFMTIAYFYGPAKAIAIGDRMVVGCFLTNDTTTKPCVKCRLHITKNHCGDYVSGELVLDLPPDMNDIAEKIESLNHMWQILDEYLRDNSVDGVQNSLIQSYESQIASSLIDIVERIRNINGLRTKL